MNALGVKQRMTPEKLLGEKVINNAAQYRAEMRRRQALRSERYEAELDKRLGDG